MERPRRATAGRNIGKLINQELGGDEFYSSAYGGFEEISGDDEYETEASEDDVVDSDFDVAEEEDEGENKDDEEFEPRRKKQWIKPYKPPKTNVPAAQHQAPPPRPKKKRRIMAPSPPTPDDSSEQRSLRKSTMELSDAYRRRRYEEQYRRRATTVKKAHPRPALTQEQMLAEARVTEIENLASLEAYTRMEEEKKKVKEKKAISHGPVVRFLSVSMPLISEVAEAPGTNRTIPESSTSSASTTGTQGSVGSADTLSQTIELQPLNNSVSSHVTSVQNLTQPLPVEQTSSEDVANIVKGSSSGKQPAKYCRNFLIFTDTNSFPEAYFNSSKPAKPRKHFCPVTSLPAKYIDPLTNTPYATPQAFKIIRNRYVSEGEQKCEKRLLQLSSWLEEKKKKKLEAKIYI